ncbi:SDR family oxidoreductase [Actinokineospora auranticolor]|uniref:NAD(P)-dependent dehydrogenase (Short-subunit alcohol dehydrogenase family) n=1 Tax=Actinokineospora auranticolor TaxID=155976 RepID=A0A2S6GDF9_9PSEU|nr:SDR family oxidoreductase [Actinokineospora auranticolor]PPK63230.1 NAD(P)-dependent dehydrogenase (short-subunit alcohol dehydrogenase family) [Actinokineospora auranticolor]
MDLGLDGRVAVVTGASRGIGLAVTRGLLDEGARVVAVSRTTGPDLAALEGPALRHLPADLTDPDAPERAVEAAVREFGALDVLVNNAGGPPPGTKLPRASFFDADDADWAAMLDFNLMTAVRAARAAIPRMLTAGGGAIVNVSTTLAVAPSPVNVDYGAAKAAVNSLGKALSEEFAPRGVRVNTVSPAGVRTPWWTDADGAADRIAAMVGADREEVLDSVGPRMLGMLTGRLIDPQEIADVVLLLCSPRSGSTTGANFTVDGGSVKVL